VPTPTPTPTPAPMPTPPTPSAPTEYGLQDLPNVSKSLMSEPPPKPSENTLTIEKPKDRKRLNIILLIVAIVVILIGAGITCYRTVPGFKEIVGGSISFSDGFDQVRARRAPQSIVIPSLPALDIMEGEEMKEEPKKVETPAVATPARPATTTATATAPTTQPATTIATQPPPARPTTTTAPATNLRYAVIGGAFAIKANADRFQADMKKEGFNSEIIFDNQRQLHLVTLGAFDTQERALKFKDEIRRTRQIGCWIYTR
jgi:flagellar basal body-associated protein FliL